MDTKKIAITAAAVLIGAASCSGRSAPPTNERQPSTVVAVDADGYVIHRFEERPRPVDERGTDPRVDPPPDRQHLACDPGAPVGWEPVSFERNRALAGVAPELLGRHRRADGSRQLTVDGCPVYRYVGNDRTAPGAWWPITVTATER